MNYLVGYIRDIKDIKIVIEDDYILDLELL